MQLVADDSFLYWTESNGGIYKTPLDALDTPAIDLVSRTTTYFPVALAVDATSVYWTDTGDYLKSNGFVMKVDLDGSNATTLVPNLTDALSVAVDASRVYWTNTANVLAVPVAGGLIQRVAIAETGAGEIRVAGTHAYWINDNMGAIRSLDLGDLNAIPQSVVSVPGSYPAHIAIDATTVYWTAFDNALDVTVEKAPLAGGDPVVLDKHESPSGDVGGYLAIDDQHVYWTTDTAVLRMGLDGTDKTTLADYNRGIRSMALGGSDVYWGADQEIEIPHGSEITNGIRKVAK